MDDLCAALGTAEVKVRRDRDERRPGDLIGDFMDRLAEGDFDKLMPRDFDRMAADGFRDVLRQIRP